jgi:hypothetical protein
VLVSYVIFNYMVSGVGVWFPLGRVYVGHSCFWYVLGDRIGVGNHVSGLARGFRRCLWLGYCFGGYGGMVGSHVRNVGLFFCLIFFVLVYVRAVCTLGVVCFTTWFRVLIVKGVRYVRCEFIYPRRNFTGEDVP